MKHALVVVAILAMTPSAHADSRDAWQATFAGSVTVALGGMITWWHGINKVDEAEQALCDGGAYPECQATTAPALDADEIDRLNAKGNRGATISYIGAGVTAVGLGVAGIALYKGFIAKRDERAVAIAPTVSRDGAGAVLSLRW